MNDLAYPFPLCIQLPADISDDTGRFRDIFQLLQELGFFGVELNVTDFEHVDPAALCEFLRTYGLKLTCLATGAYAKKHGLSLSTPDEGVRRRSTDLLCQVLIPFAQRARCDLICGFLKDSGGGSEQQLARSLEEVRARVPDTSVRLYLEATNRKEAAVVNRLEQGAALARAPWYVLPDTYHMHLEERDPVEALLTNLTLFRNLHISDIDRRFPGYGRSDLPRIFRALKSAQWKGTVTIEGIWEGSLAENIRTSSEYLRGLSL